jgi:diaminopimelate epimerase
MGAMGRPFLKMNGLGNDFVVVDARSEPFTPSADEVRAIAGRAGGIGCDQLIAIEPFARADAFMRIWNADGGEVDACGNAARCVAWLLTEGQRFDRVVIETRGGPLFAVRETPTTVRVDMGEPRLNWRDIPLAEEMSTRTVPLRIGPADAPVMEGPGCVSMGNPHVVFFVPDAETAPVERAGPLIEHHPLFPERVNVGFAQIKAPDRIRLRVWERGAGLTKACGTGACAALVAAARRELTGHAATLELDGGQLQIEWAEDDNHVFMTGPIEVEFEGELP